MPDDDRHPEDTRDHAKRLAELIESVRYAMVTSRAADDSLRARPLTTLRVERKDTLVCEFIIDADSKLACDISADPQINLAYCNPSKDIYATVSAEAHLSEDLARKRSLWNALVQAWFPGGPDDPASVLLVAELRSAEYWHVEQGKLAQTFQMLKATARGTQATLETEHGKVDAG
jgi:general stress protein 26